MQRKTGKTPSKPEAGRCVLYNMSRSPLSREVKCVYNSGVEWIKNRKRFQKELIKLANKLNEHQQNVNVVKLTGSTSAVVGALMVFGALVAAPLTGGASLPAVAAVGAGIGGVGGATAGGAEIVNQILRKDIFEDAQKILRRDQELKSKLQSHLQMLDKEAKSCKSKKGLEELEIDLFELASNLGGVFKILRDSISGAKSLLNQGKMTLAAADAGFSVFKALRAGKAAFRIAGGAVVLLDVMSLFEAAINLKEGSVTNAEKELRTIASEMACPDEEDVEDMIRQYLKELFLQ